MFFIKRIRFLSERINTTVPKAKVARQYADKMITLAKRGDLHARRQAARFIADPKVLQKLFADLGPRFAERPGGYTRMVRAGIRRGDDADLAIYTIEIEQIEDELRSLQLGEDISNGDSSLSELEMELVAINNDFWKE